MFNMKVHLITKCYIVIGSYPQLVLIKLRYVWKLVFALIYLYNFNSYINNNQYFLS